MNSCETEIMQADYLEVCIAEDVLFIPLIVYYQNLFPVAFMFL